MKNLKINSFYEVISTGVVVQLINVTGVIATCSYQGQSRTFTHAVDNLKYLGDSYKPLKPPAFDLVKLIEERNKEIHTFNQGKIKKSKDPQLDISRLILLTPIEELDDLLISRGLKEPINEEEL